MKIRLPVRLPTLAVLLAGASFMLLSACETAKPRGPQPKSSSMPWDRPKKGQGAGPLGGFMPQQY
jgi:hypothetical protein